MNTKYINKEISKNKEEMLMNGSLALITLKGMMTSYSNILQIYEQHVSEPFIDSSVY